MDDRSPMARASSAPSRRCLLIGRTQSIPFICLQITEILENVIDLAMLGESSLETVAKEDRHTLLAIALTCRTFLEPALDRLWRTLIHLCTAYQDTPSGLLGRGWRNPCRERAGISIYDCYRLIDRLFKTLGRQLPPKHWTRLKFYASRVRNLGYDPHNPSALSWAGSELMKPDLELLKGFRAHKPGSPLLPNLQRLCWTSSQCRPEAVPYIELFIIPSLKALTFDFSPPFRLRTDSGVNVFVTTVLRHVRERCPTFAGLTMKPLPSYDLLHDLHNPVSISLQTRVPRLDEEDVKCLASIHSLRQACIRLAHSNDIPRTHNPLPPSASLRMLHILVSLLRSFQALLEAASFSRLEDISICAEQTPSASATQQLLDQLAARCDRSTLHTIRLFGVPSQSRHHPADEHRPPAHVHPVTARTLAAFSRMRILEVDSVGLYDFDGNSVTEMVAAWPALVLLSIGTFQGSWASSGVAIGALCRVLEVCPRLQLCGVKVRLDAEDVNEERLAARQPFLMRGLVSLDGGSPWIDNERHRRACKEILTQLFPGVRSIGCGGREIHNEGREMLRM